MDRIPESEWVHYGFAGHLCVGSRCSFHMATRIGKVLISTLGAYKPQKACRDIDPFEEVGIGRLFETFVFTCDGDDDNGNPNMGDSEIDTESYNDSLDAEKGHREFCLRYAENQEALTV